VSDERFAAPRVSDERFIREERIDQS